LTDYPSTQDQVSKSLEELKTSVTEYVDSSVETVRGEARRMYYFALGVSVSLTIVLFIVAMNIIQEGAL
jgi:hypothetical protein